MQSQETDRLRRKILQDIEEMKQKSLSDSTYLPSDTFSVQCICFQKIQPVVRNLLEKNFLHLKKIHINNCDLRTFENFPCLPNLVQVNASKNSMRGSFQFIVKNRSISYMDISDNFIADIKRFQPLRMLRDISIYAKGNPFLKQVTSQNTNGVPGKDSIASKLKVYGVVLLKQARKNEVKLEEKCKIEEKQQNQPKANNKNENSTLPGSIGNTSFMRDVQADRNRDRQRDRERLNFLCSDDSIEDILIRGEDHPFGTGRIGRGLDDPGQSIRPGLLRLIRERGELQNLLCSGGNLQIRRSSTAQRNEAAFLDSQNVPDEEDDDDQDEQDMMQDDDMDEDDEIDGGLDEIDDALEEYEQIDSDDDGEEQV